MAEMQKLLVSISNRTIVRMILWVVAAILAYHFVGRITHVLVLIFFSIFLALAINPVVGWMRHRLHINSRVRATAASYLVVVVVLAAFFALVTPPLVTQTRDFIKTVPQTIENFQSQDSGLARTVRRYHLDERLVQGAKEFTGQYGNFGSAVLNTSKRIAEAVTSVLIVLVLTFMILVEGPRWLELYFGTLNEKDRVRYKKLSFRMYKSVSGFVNGQFILAIIAGLFAFVALEIASNVLNVSINAPALAGIVAVFGIIPLFGNPLAAIIVVLVCLLNSLTLGLVMAIYFVIYFFVENHTFQPYLQSRLNELTPLMVFIAALIGVSLGGILGAVIAIPAASSVKILLEDHFEQRQHRKAPTVPSSN